MIFEENFERALESERQCCSQYPLELLRLSTISSSNSGASALSDECARPLLIEHDHDYGFCPIQTYLQ